MRVLVVEDEPSMAASLRSGLESEGFAVEVTGDGAEALWLASEFDYDAMVLDIMLPSLNGFAIVSRLREVGRTVPVLMLTAKQGEADQTEALESGADDFLSKPFSYPVLLARLRALIRRAGGRSRADLTAGDLRLDPAAHRCWRGDVEIELTARELSLLEYLMHRRGDVVDKFEVLRHVWGDDDTITPNTVEVYIGYLRRKIDVPFGRHALETVRGRGYRLEADGG
ncbi:MAG: hypothetical protein QOJ19_3704 [Acidimicrobiia bacterium]|jgi:DNA-binding response OmpR family regulator|nr:hypothetical protein [Acidimicrobiia bacterium]